MVVDHQLAVLAANVDAARAERFPRHTVADLSVLPGGHSGVTHVATLHGAGSGTFRAVVKSTPLGRAPKGRHDVLRQAEVLKALGDWGGVAAPKVLFEANDPTPLFGMELIEGSAVEPIIEETEVLPADRLGALWREAIELLVSLQLASPQELGLQDEPVVTPAQELERWGATMRAAGLNQSDKRGPALEGLLGKRVPHPAPPRLVHGDFRLGNILQRDGRIGALVDWEIWSIGDPRSDLGWLTIFADHTNYPSVGREAPGTPTASEVIDRYLESGGIGSGDIPWFRALACFKLASVQAHNLRRHREGRYYDPYQERLVDGTGALLDRGLTLLRDESA